MPIEVRRLSAMPAGRYEKQRLAASRWPYELPENGESMNKVSVRSTTTVEPDASIRSNAAPRRVGS
jgi:hypothetical protein